MTVRSPSPPLLARDEALEEWLGGLALPPPVDLALEDGWGRVLAVQAKALLPIPARDEAAARGVGACSADLENVPVRLVRSPERSTRLPRGHGIRLRRGEAMPTGADVVLPDEFVKVEDSGWTVGVAPAHGTFVRSRGEEALPGDPLLEAGTVLGAEEMALLARAGWNRALVLPPPEIATLVVTAREEVWGREPVTGAVPEELGPWLTGTLASLGHVPLRLGGAQQDDDDLPVRVEIAAELADLLIVACPEPMEMVPRLRDRLGAGCLVADLASDAAAPWCVRQGSRCVLLISRDKWALASAVALLVRPYLELRMGRPWAQGVWMDLDEPDSWPEGRWWPCRTGPAGPVPLERGDTISGCSWACRQGLRLRVIG